MQILPMGIASPGFIIAAVGHVLLRSGLTLHILLLVLFFFLMQGVGRMMN